MKISIKPQSQTALWEIHKLDLSIPAITFQGTMGLAAAAAEKAAYEKGGYAGLMKYKFMIAYRYMKTNCCCA
ncbi:hypothetical protein IV203_023996 [Nitzschia inconspicua]|uniref:Uncharacterized protein n=1 Tax=Nitzschia inconspicua TaxID=303405 RepID=A0A9K3PAN6_9STRA|nr:hypothetical protein IV203_024482 [Nitzschia inconspicua]KAG7340453.1 hypothetical protein IV203_023996 [Nitzschia inconspicua]